MDGADALLFTGYMDQTDIFFRSAQVLGGETSLLDKLFEALQIERRKPVQ